MICCKKMFFLYFVVTFHLLEKWYIWFVFLSKCLKYGFKAPDRHRFSGQCAAGMWPSEAPGEAPMCRYLPIRICLLFIFLSMAPSSEIISSYSTLHLYLACVAKMWTGSRLPSLWHFDVSSVIAVGLSPLSLEGFDMKSRLASQVYPMAADPGLKQSAPSLWDTITGEWGTRNGGLPQPWKPLFLQVTNTLWGVLIKL